MSVMPNVRISRVFEAENVTIRPGSLKPFSSALIGAGAVALLLTVIAGVIRGSADDPASRAAAADGASAALHAYHTGSLIVLSLVLGALVFYMISTAAKAGWWVLIKRPFEHAMSLVWVPLVLFIGAVVLQALFVNVQGVETDKGAGLYAPFLWNWMDPQYRAGDPLYEHKAMYLDTAWFWVRALLYFSVWIALCKVIVGIARTQERDGNKWHTATLVKVSVVGLPLFAFATAFASFDWMMGLDYHWFSTMFGVYFFAGGVLAMLCLGNLALILLRTFGKMRGAFTVEHQHDMSKLIFAFVVFWAYITFSQYFLIWYAAIPEESMWFGWRKDNWGWLEWAIPIGHFIIPFLVLLPRPARRSTAVMTVMCLWLIGMHVLDIFWVVRPEVKGVGSIVWQDIVGVAGPLLIFLGLYVRKFESVELIPRNDPRTHEALEHKNFV